MGRKIVIVFLLILSNIIFANSLQSINYRNGVLTLTFQSNISKIHENFDHSTPSLSIEVEKTSEYNKKNNFSQIEINDKYISDLVTDYYDNTTNFVMYLEIGTTYTAKVKKNEIIINFIEAKTLPKRNYTIVLDAGHGGHDSGAIGNGYKEKDLALAVTLQLYENLKRDYNVILTRDTDFFIPLNTRADIGNKANANLFISIHLNSSPNSKANGAEVYYFEKNPSAYAKDKAKYENSFDEEGAKAVEASKFVINDVLYGINQRESSIVANTVLNNLVDTISIAKRKVYGANFAVLRGSKSPSILVELGFISNYNDVRFFTSEEGQRKAAGAIADAIRKHY